MEDYSDVDDPNDEFDQHNDTDDMDSCSDLEDEKKSDLKTLSKADDGYCCKKKCLHMFDDDFKLRLKTDLSRLDRSARHVYLFAMISIGEKKKHLGKVIKSAKAFQYAVKEYGVLRYVCKTAFILLHDTTLSLVRTLCKKMASNHLIPSDNRGRHDNRHTISVKTQEQIKIHFFETLHSPDIFKCSKKNLGTPNIHQLWFDFTGKHGHIARSTYERYIWSLLTPEVLQKFMCANGAQKILKDINLYKDKYYKKNKLG